MENSKMLSEGFEIIQSLRQCLQFASGKSILGAKLETVWLCANFVRMAGIRGCSAELGVYRGGTARFIAKMLPDEESFLFDTFAGMPKEGSCDVHKQGDFGDTSSLEVAKFVSDCSNAVIVEGFFPESATNLQEKRFCFVHLDADLYTSTKAGLDWFYPRMSPGGIILLDDYLWERCPGVERALSEFLKTNAAQVWTLRHQAIIRR